MKKKKRVPKREPKKSSKAIVKKMKAKADEVTKAKINEAVKAEKRRDVLAQEKYNEKINKWQSALATVLQTDEVEARRVAKFVAMYDA